MNVPAGSNADAFPTKNTLSALGGFEWIIQPPTGSTTLRIRFGWFEDSGSGSSVRWSSGDGPQVDLPQGVHELESSGDLLLLGATGEDAKIVAAWDPAP
jgi:hypothetical protein